MEPILFVIRETKIRLSSTFAGQIAQLASRAKAVLDLCPALRERASCKRDRVCCKVVRTREVSRRRAGELLELR